MMGRFDIPTIIYALLQGLACEIIFAIFRYKSRAFMVAILAVWQPQSLVYLSTGTMVT